MFSLARNVLFISLSSEYSQFLPTLTTPHYIVFLLSSSQHGAIVTDYILLIIGEGDIFDILMQERDQELESVSSIETEPCLSMHY